MIIAWFGIVISSKNEIISSWSIFFLIIYVAYEFMFSVLRRILSKKSPFQADNLHLHSLLYSLLLKKLTYLKKITINNLTGIILTSFGSIPSVLILCFDFNFKIIIVCTILYIILYTIIYFIIFRILQEN